MFSSDVCVADAENISGASNLSSIAKVSIDFLQQYVKGINGANTQTQLECTKAVRKLLSIERNPPIQDVIQTGVIPRLVQFLANFDNDRLQFEAAWALTNIASGSANETKVVIENNAVPLFSQLLRSPCTDVREQAVWALSNIAGESPECRDMVLGTGAMPLLLQLLQNAHDKLSLMRNATWCLSNLCRGKPQPEFKHVAQALPMLSQLINVNGMHITHTHLQTYTLNCFILVFIFILFCSVVAWDGVLVGCFIWVVYEREQYDFSLSLSHTHTYMSHIHTCVCVSCDDDVVWMIIYVYAYVYRQ